MARFLGGLKTSGKYKDFDGKPREELRDLDESQWRENAFRSLPFIRKTSNLTLNTSRAKQGRSSFAGNTGRSPLISF